MEEVAGRAVSYVVGVAGGLVGLVLVVLMRGLPANVGLMVSGVAVVYLAARSKHDDRIRMTVLLFVALLVEIVCIGMLVSPPQ